MQNEMTRGRYDSCYNSSNEQHIHAIDGLVQELGIPAEEVNRSYREILDELKQDSNLKAFMPALVIQGVKARLQQK